MFVNRWPVPRQVSIAYCGPTSAAVSYTAPLISDGGGCVMMSRQASTYAMFLVATLMVAAILATEAASGTGAGRWYIVHRALDDQGQSLNIGPAAQTIALKGGWTCRVGSTSVTEARQTLCKNGSHAVEFSVQCGPDRLKDHAQIRFKDEAGRPIDFIEVGCELRR
jgi:hypothetical protein